MNIKHLITSFLVFFVMFSCNQDDSDLIIDAANDEQQLEVYSGKGNNTEKNESDRAIISILNPSSEAYDCDAYYKSPTEVIYIELSKNLSERKEQIENYQTFFRNAYLKRYDPEYPCSRWVIPWLYSPSSYDPTTLSYSEIWYEFLPHGIRPSNTVKKRKIDVRSPQL